LKDDLPQISDTSRYLTQHLLHAPAPSEKPAASMGVPGPTSSRTCVTVHRISSVCAAEKERGCSSAAPPQPLAFITTQQTPASSRADLAAHWMYFSAVVVGNRGCVCRGGVCSYLSCRQ
jgi:hypothetical protein